MACELVACCTDGNQTGKQEGTGFAFDVGAQHNVLPFLTFCGIQANVTLEVWNGSAFEAMYGSSILDGSPATRKVSMGRNCPKNAAFTITPQSGSGGSTHNCRAKVTTKTTTRYCTFTVQVDAAAVTFTPQVTII
jgi:hypothetical protein